MPALDHFEVHSPTGPRGVVTERVACICRVGMLWSPTQQSARVTAVLSLRAAVLCRGS